MGNIVINQYRNSLSIKGIQLSELVRNPGPGKMEGTDTPSTPASGSGKLAGAMSKRGQCHNLRPKCRSS